MGGWRDGRLGRCVIGEMWQKVEIIGGASFFDQMILFYNFV